MLAKPLNENKIFLRVKLLNKINVIPTQGIDTIRKVNSLGIDFDGLSTLRLIHHFPETHQLPLCHINFLKMTQSVTWRKGFSCQNDLRKQASKKLHGRHVDWFMGLYPGEYWPLFPITFHFKKYYLAWRIHILHINRIEAFQVKNQPHFNKVNKINQHLQIIFRKMIGNYNSTFLYYSKIRT